MQTETVSQFESRKREHIELALKDENEALGFSGFDHVKLVHEALPEKNFSDIKIHTEILGQKAATPFLISSMTAGHAGAVNLNQRFARAAAARGWLMGVGSQRRELGDLGDLESGRHEWQQVRAVAPQVRLLGNIGLAQAIQATDDQLKSLIDSLEAVALIVHLNPLQECLQLEGTPDYQGGLKRLTRLAAAIAVPVVVKETGCGFSVSTLQRLRETGVAAVDVSGFGGTHWGRIEGDRATAATRESAAASSLKGESLKQAAASETFAQWGISTVQSLLNARQAFGLDSLTNIDLDVGAGAQKYAPEIWASGGLRSGLDAAKAFAMGAQCAGFAKPILQAALKSEEELNLKMETLEHEFKIAIFCTGGSVPSDLQRGSIWQVRPENSHGQCEREGSRG